MVWQQLIVKMKVLKNELSAIEIAVPSIELQNEFVTYVKEADKLKFIILVG